MLKLEINVPEPNIVVCQPSGCVSRIMGYGDRKWYVQLSFSSALCSHPCNHHELKSLLFVSVMMFKNKCILQRAMY